MQLGARRRMSRTPGWLRFGVTLSVVSAVGVIGAYIFNGVSIEGSGVNEESIVTADLTPELANAIEVFTDEHPEVEVVVSADWVTYGYDRTEVVGYVEVYAEEPVIYLSGAYTGPLTWEYLLEHEYAHLLQGRIVTERTGAIPGETPAQTATYYQAMQELDAELAAAVGAEPEFSTDNTWGGLEVAADCYAQIQAGTQTSPYLSETCSSEGMAAMSAVADGQWPTVEAMAQYMPALRSTSTVTSDASGPVDEALRSQGL